MINPTCPNCHAPLNPGSRFCTSCGQPVPAPQPSSAIGAACPSCGRPYTPGAKFCRACGGALPQVSAGYPSQAVPPPIAGYPSQAAPQWANPPQAHPVAAPARRKKVPLLAWLLGGAIGLCLCAAVVAGGYYIYTNPDVIGLDGSTSTTEEDTPVEPTRTTRPTRTPQTPTAAPTDTPTPDYTATPTATVTPTVRPEGTPLVGHLSPDFTLIDANTGELVTLSQFTGQPVMVNFWATWCGYCTDEMPYLQAAYEAHQADGLVILGVDYEDTQSDVVDYGQNHGLTFPLLLDEDGDLTSDVYLVNGFPTSFFIYPDGIIASIQIGSMTEEQLNRYLDEILP